MQEKQSDLLKFAMTLAKEAARILLKTQPMAKIAVNKIKGDFALDADIASENYIVKQIKRKYPNHDILTEETKHQHKQSDYLWVIDPLEGTLNYAHKLPIWAVNIGLFYKRKPFLGVIYAPILKELFHAAKGKGAYLNGKRIHVNKQTEIIKSFFAAPSAQINEIPISKTIIRSIGCAGIDLAYVACGRFGARIKLRGADPYGYGAGSILVLEAGGKITSVRGEKWVLTSDGTIASNGLLHEKLLKLFNNTS